jgi:hypothetical protein
LLGCRGSWQTWTGRTGCRCGTQREISNALYLHCSLTDTLAQTGENAKHCSCCILH